MLRGSRNVILTPRMVQQIKESQEKMLHTDDVIRRYTWRQAVWSTPTSLNVGLSRSLLGEMTDACLLVPAREGTHLDGLLFTKDKDEAEPDETLGLTSNLQERPGENGKC